MGGSLLFREADKDAQYTFHNMHKVREDEWAGVTHEEGWVDIMNGMCESVTLEDWPSADFGGRKKAHKSESRLSASVDWKRRGRGHEERGDVIRSK